MGMRHGSISVWRTGGTPLILPGLWLVFAMVGWVLWRKVYFDRGSDGIIVRKLDVWSHLLRRGLWVWNRTLMVRRKRKNCVTVSSFLSQLESQEPKVRSANMCTDTSQTVGHVSCSPTVWSMTACTSPQVVQQKTSRLEWCILREEGDNRHHRMSSKDHCV